MDRPEDLTYGVPRFLSFIDMAYLLEAVETADATLAARIPTPSAEVHRDLIGNVNASRQALLRAAFVSLVSILEQNIDELVHMEQKKRGIVISPSDLKDRGIVRSLNYAEKALNTPIDTHKAHWKHALLLQDLRNHLVHYGPEFTDSEDHTAKVKRFSKSPRVSVRPSICFSIEQLKEIVEDFAMCIEDFGGM
jgi:hypothetical protein